MPTLVGPSSGIASPRAAHGVRPVTQILEAAYARERLEDSIRAVVEDALAPSRSDVLPWHDEAGFEADLENVVREIAAAVNVLLAARLVDLIDSAPPRVAGRLASVPRWHEHA